MFSDRFVCAAAIALAAGSLVLTLGCRKEEAKQVSLPAVVVDSVVEMEFADTVTEIGEVKAFDTVGLSANVSGFLTEANFKEGELVKKGTKLFQIDPSVYDAAVNKADAEVRKAEAKLTNAQLEYNRQERLLSKDASSKSKYDTAEMNLRTAQAELKSAEAALAEKKVDLNYTRILAPFDGYIGFKQFSVGNMVGPSSGALARITRSGNVKIYFSIDELTMLRIYDNYPSTAEKDTTNTPKVRVFLQNGREYKEKVWISAWNNMVQDGTFQIQATAENPKDLLVAGQYVKVVVQVSPLKRRTMVKQEAIMREQLGTFVFVVDARNRIERRKIVTGMKNGSYQVVLSGLKPGERVVVEGLQKAGSGDEVKPITARQTAPGGASAKQPAQSKPADGTATAVPEKKNAAKK